MKNGLKRVLSLVLTICMIASLLPTSVFAEIYGTASSSVDMKSLLSDVKVATYVFTVDGETVSTQSIKNNETLLEPATPVKEGYKFVGWYDGENEFTSFNTAIAVSETKTVTLTAKFAAVRYVFFYNQDGVVCYTIESADGETVANLSDANDSVAVSNTESVTGWTKDGAEVASVTLSGANIYLNPVVTEGFWITYNTNGGSPISSSFYLSTAKTAAPAAPTKAGYTFKGWYKDEALTQAFSFGGSVSSATTLYAKWEAKDVTYTINYWLQKSTDAVGATDDAKTYDYAECATGTGKAGSTVTPSSLKSFKGFDLNTNKTVKTVINGDGTTIVNVYLDRKVCTVNFMLCGDGKTTYSCGKQAHTHSYPNGCYNFFGNLTCKKTEHTHTDACNPVTNPNGWYVDSSVQGLYGAVFADEVWRTDHYWYSSYDGRSTSGSGCILLTTFDFATAGYASNKDNEKASDGTVITCNFYGTNQETSKTIYYYNEKADGSFALAGTVKAGSGTLTIHEKYSGYELYRFTTGNPSGDKTSATFWKDKSKVSDGTTTDKSTVYIASTLKKYELSFYNYNGVAKTENVKYTASLESFASYVPAKPSGLSNDFTFQGWYADKACTVPFDFNTTMPNAGLQIYAKWAEPTYDVTVYVTIEGINSLGDNVKVEVPYNQPISAEKWAELEATAKENAPDGYEFAGWFTGNPKNPVNTTDVITGNMSIYPLYNVAGGYTVTYYDGTEKTNSVVDSKKYTISAKAEIAANTFTAPEGKVFVYWTDGTNKYYPGDKIDVTGNVELTAVWANTPQEVTLTYFYNAPNGEEKYVEESYANNATVALKSISELGWTAPAGYEFLGWAQDPSATTAKFAVPGSVVIDRDDSGNTLYAVWKLTTVSYTINYYLNGTTKTVAAQVVSTGKLGETVDGTKTISGYQAVAAESKMTLTAGTDNVLNVLYYKEVELTANSKTDAVYDGNEKEVSGYTVSGTIEGYTADFGAITVGAKGTDAGSYPAAFAEGTVGKIDANKYYVVAAANNGKLVISQSTGEIAITFNGLEKTYDAQGHIVEAASSTVSGTTFSYKLGNGEYTTDLSSLAQTEAGTYEITVKAENANFASATTKTVTLKINPVAITFTGKSDTKTYTGTEQTVEGWSITSGALVGEQTAVLTASASGTEASATPYTGTISAVKIVAKDAEDKEIDVTGNYAIKTEPGTLTITKSDAVWTISLANDEKTYNGQAQGTSKTAVSNAASGTTTFSYSFEKEGTYVEDLSTLTKVDAGEYTIYVKATNPNYSKTAAATATLTIKPIAITFTGDSDSKTYDGNAHEVTTYKITSGALVNGQTADVKASASRTEVGTTTGTITVVIKDSSNNDVSKNYTITAKPGTMTINANTAGWSISMGNTEVTYDGQPHGMAAAATSEAAGTTTFTYSFTQDGTYTEDLSSLTQVNAGTYTVYVKATNPGYSEAATNTATLIINKRPVTFTAKSEEKDYTGSLITINTVTSDGLVSGHTSNVTFKAEGTAAGTYPGTITDKVVIKNGETDVTNNYIIKTENGSLTIKKLPATDWSISFEDKKNVPYDGEEHSLDAATTTASGETTFVYELNGVKDTDVTKLTGTDVGTYTITVTATNPNYEGTKTETAVLEITKRNVTFKANSAEFTYDGSEKSVAADSFTAEGLVTGHASNVTVSGKGTEAGTYPVKINAEGPVKITADGTDVTENYHITVVNSTMTIRQSDADWEITLADDSKLYNGEAQGTSKTAVSKAASGTTTFSYSFEAEGTYVEDLSSLTKVDAGEYTIYVKATNPNYSKTAARTAKLTITKREVTFTAVSDKKEYTGETITISGVTAGGKDGLAAGHTSTAAATVSGIEAGEYDNVIADGVKIMNGSVDVTSNYIIKTENGKLTIKKSTADWTITLEGDTHAYDGKEHYNTNQPANTAKTGKTEYSFNWTGESEKTNLLTSMTKIKAGTYPITVTATNPNYEKTATCESYLKITPKSIVPNTPVDPTDPEDPSNKGIQVNDPSDATYDGDTHKFVPEITDKDTNSTLKERDDYTVEYKRGDESTTDFTNAGTITVVIKGTGNYEGEITITYTINPAALTVKTDSAAATVSELEALENKTLTAKGTVTGFVIGETYTFTVTGKQAAVGTSNNTYKLDFNGTAKKSNYKLTSEVLGTLTVTDTKDAVVVTVTGGTFTYDGKAHGVTVEVTAPAGYTATATCDVTLTDVGELTNIGLNGTNVTVTITRDSDGTEVTLPVTYVAGSLKVTPAELKVTTESAAKYYDGTALTANGKVEGFVNGETATFTVTGTQTAVGTSDNTYTLDFNGTAKESNYEVVKSIGTLKVFKQSIDPEDSNEVLDPTKDPTDPDTNGKYSGVETDKPDDVEYDGDDHKWVPTITDPTNKDSNGDPTKLTEGTDYEVVYKRDGVETDDFTSAGTITVEITGKDNYTGTITEEYTITAKAATVVVDDAQKVFGSEDPAFTGTVEGLVDGDSLANFKYVRSNDAEDVGEYEGVLTATFDENKNYTVTVTNGNFKITAKSIIPADPDKDPDNDPNKDSTITTNTPDDVTYDGEDHKFVPEIKDTETGKELEEGKDYTVEYKRDGETTDDFTNAGEITVIVTGKDNYEGSYEVTYEITKRAVTFVAASNNWEFDGTEHTDDGFTAEEGTNANEGLAAQHEAEATVTGKITLAGKTPNVVSDAVITANGKDVTANYDISYKSGELTVTNRTNKYDVNVTANSGTAVYNGQAFTVEGYSIDVEAAQMMARMMSRMLSTEPTVNGNSFTINGVTYTISGLSAAAEMTDAGKAETLVTGTAVITMTVDGKEVDVTENFNVNLMTGSIEVTPRNVTLSSGSAAKRYDGTALTYNYVVVGGDGFAEGEGASYNVYGSRTDIGTGSNAFEYSLNENTKASNYVISTVFGYLTVTPEPVYTLTVHYTYEDGSEAQPDYVGTFAAGAQYRVETPAITGYTPNYAYIQSNEEGMPAEDLEYTVVYAKDEEEVIPDKGATVSTEPPYDLVSIEDEEIPLAQGEHVDCILHFLLMAAAFVVQIVYTKERKKYQEKIFALKKLLGDKDMNDLD